MFIIPPYIRIALIIVGIVGGIGLWAAFGFWYGFFFLLAGVILLAGLIFMGTVGPASQALQEQDFDKAEKLLNLTPNPKWLYVTNRAYYYMLKGNIALSRRDIEEGERLLKMAESIDVPTDNEKAMLQIQLAQISASRGRWKEAKIYFKKAKECNISEGPIKEQFKELEKIMAQSGQSRAAMRMGKQGHGMMRQMGKSKRRRPKMR